MNQSRKSPNNPRKSKIFEKFGVTPSKSLDSFMKLQKVPNRKEESQQRISKNKNVSGIEGSRLNQS